MKTSIDHLQESINEAKAAIEDALAQFEDLKDRYAMLLEAAENVDQYDFSDDLDRANKEGAPTDGYTALGELTTVLHKIKQNV